MHTGRYTNVYAFVGLLHKMKYFFNARIWNVLSTHCEVRAMRSRRLLAVEFQLDSDSDALVVIGWVAIARQADDG